VYHEPLWYKHSGIIFGPFCPSPSHLCISNPGSLYSQNIQIAKTRIFILFSLVLHPLCYIYSVDTHVFTHVLVRHSQILLTQDHISQFPLPWPCDWVMAVGVQKELASLPAAESPQEWAPLNLPLMKQSRRGGERSHSLWAGTPDTFWGGCPDTSHCATCKK
jgi:hypothetical protein